MRLAAGGLEVAADAEWFNVRSINQLPGAWEHRLDKNWTLAVNGHAEPVTSRPDGCMPCAIPGWCMAVWWNGWLAGIIAPSGGSFVAGRGANEDAFIAAIENAVAEVPAHA